MKSQEHSNSHADVSVIASVATPLGAMLKNAKSSLFNSNRKLSDHQIPSRLARSIRYQIRRLQVQRVRHVRHTSRSVRHFLSIARAQKRGKRVDGEERASNISDAASVQLSEEEIRLGREVRGLRPFVGEGWTQSVRRCSILPFVRDVVHLNPQATSCTIDIFEQLAIEPTFQLAGQPRGIAATFHFASHVSLVLRVYPAPG